MSCIDYENVGDAKIDEFSSLKGRLYYKGRYILPSERLAIEENKGFQQGLLEGSEMGHLSGFEIGQENGMKEGLERCAMRMLQADISLNVISNVTTLSLKKLHFLSLSLKKRTANISLR